MKTKGHGSLGISTLRCAIGLYRRPRVIARDTPFVGRTRRTLPLSLLCFMSALQNPYLD